MIDKFQVKEIYLFALYLKIESFPLTCSYQIANNDIGINYQHKDFDNTRIDGKKQDINNCKILVQHQYSKVFLQSSLVVTGQEERLLSPWGHDTTGFVLIEIKFFVFSL